MRSLFVPTAESHFYCPSYETRAKRILQTRVVPAGQPYNIAGRAPIFRIVGTPDEQTMHGSLAISCFRTQYAAANLTVYVSLLLEDRPFSVSVLGSSRRVFR